MNVCRGLYDLHWEALYFSGLELELVTGDLDSRPGSDLLCNTGHVT